jgi:hypothetical protein
VNVPYGGFGTPAGVDGRGYLPVPVGDGNPGFADGTFTDYFNANVNSGDLDTMFIVPAPTVGRVLVVYCNDSAYQQPTSCTLEQPEVL